MKKKFTALFLLTILILSGCMNQGAAGAVEDMYKAAIDGDGEKIDKLFSQAEEYDREYLDDLIDSLTYTVMEVDGIKNLNIKEIKKNALNKEAIEDLNDEYGNNWELVNTQLEDDYFYVWVLKEVSGKRFVVYGEDFDKEDLEEMFK